MLILVATRLFKFYQGVSDFALDNTVLMFKESVFVSLERGASAISSSAQILGNGNTLHFSGAGSYLFERFSGMVQDLTIVAVDYGRYAFANRLDTARFINVEVICTGGRYAFGYGIDTYINGLVVRSTVTDASERIFENSVIHCEIIGVLAATFNFSAQVSDSSISNVIVNSFGDTFSGNSAQFLYCVVENDNCELLTGNEQVFAGSGQQSFLYLETRLESEFVLEVKRFVCDRQQILMQEECEPQTCIEGYSICESKALCVDLRCEACKRDFCEDFNAEPVIIIVLASVLAAVCVILVVLIVTRKGKSQLRRVKKPLKTEAIRQQSLDLALIQSK